MPNDADQDYVPRRPGEHDADAYEEARAMAAGQRLGLVGSYLAQARALWRKNLTVVRANWLSNIVGRIFVPVFVASLSFAVVLWLEISRLQLNRSNPEPIEAHAIPRCEGTFFGEPCRTFAWGPADNQLARHAMQLILERNSPQMTLADDTHAYTRYGPFVVGMRGNGMNVLRSQYRAGVWFWDDWDGVSSDVSLNYTIFANLTAEPVDALNFNDALFQDYSMPFKLALDESFLSLMLSPTPGLDDASDFTLVASRDDIETSGSSLDTIRIVQATVVPFMLVVALFANLVLPSVWMNYEREAKVDTMLKRFGMRSSVNWWSWFSFHLTFVFVETLLILVVGYALQIEIFSRANFVVWFAALFGFGWMLTGQGMFVASICHSQVAATFASTIFIVTSLVFVIVDNDIVLGNVFERTPAFPKALVRFLTPSLFFSRFANDVAVATIGQMPGSPVPRHYSFGNFTHAWNQTKAYGGAYSEFGFSYRYNTVPMARAAIVDVTLLFLVGSFATLVGFYIESLRESMEGLRRRWFFPLQPSFWGWGSRRALDVQYARHRASQLYSVLPDTDADIVREYQEAIRGADLNDRDLLLTTVKLSHTYGGSGCFGRDMSDNRALDNLTLAARRSSVFCLLGHNGSGKTTTISILTGALKASSGDAVVCGLSLSAGLDYILTRIGVCPQESVSWKELTLEQHLSLFGTMRGLHGEALAREVTARLADVHLEPQRTQTVGTLSGGQLRRLCVTTAFIDNPEIVFLDEPCAGIDPISRRYLWKLVRTKKQGRLVVLCTHSLEEADRLSDKVAILANGRLRAIGSTDHLKARYGAGYRIAIVVAGCSSQDLDRTQEQHDRLEAKVAELLPSARLENVSADSLTFSVPWLKSRLLKPFFAFVEAQIQVAENDPNKLVSDWSISHPTLDDVFILVSHGGGNQATSSNIVDVMVQNHKIDQVEGQVEDLENAKEELATVLSDVRSELEEERRRREETEAELDRLRRQLANS